MGMMQESRVPRSPAKVRPQDLPAIVAPVDPKRQQRRARWLQRELDFQLGRLVGRKRFGLMWISLAVVLAATLLIPVGWVWSTRESGPAGTPALMGAAADAVALRYEPLPIAEIDRDLLEAVIAARDPAFCGRTDAVAGLDPARRGLIEETAEATFLWPGGPSPVRGFFAGYFAALMDVFWSRPRILEAYVNGVVWGEGIVGAEAAAQARFGRSARDLDRLHHAIPLAAAIANPRQLTAEGAGPAVRAVASSLSARIQAMEGAGAFGCLDAVAP
jgi:monofunctional biosynthetic peptidoglycan transglycosylase